jgi:hypothetical protein
MKLFIFSTHTNNIDSKSIIEELCSVENCSIRTTGSKGLDSLLVGKFPLLEIYIPWQGFNDYLSGEYSIDQSNVNVKCPTVSKNSLEILDSSILGELKSNYLKIDNRLVYGMLGDDLNDPVDLVIVNNIDSNRLPTTSSALVERIAFNNGIRSINLEYTPLNEFKEILSSI